MNPSVASELAKLTAAAERLTAQQDLADARAELDALRAPGEARAAIHAGVAAVRQERDSAYRALLAADTAAVRHLDVLDAYTRSRS
ncbi:MAG: hypothetical protein JWR63_1876 [Conexibacter sp.]|nr:hypothetical protein [Conexibacter sp.]